jgi:hypothetical protein
MATNMTNLYITVQHKEFGMVNYTTNISNKICSKAVALRQSIKKHWKGIQKGDDNIPEMLTIKQLPAR